MQALKERWKKKLKKKDKWYPNAFAFFHAKPLWSRQKLCLCAKVLWIPENFVCLIKICEMLTNFAFTKYCDCHIAFAFSREIFFRLLAKNFGCVRLQKFGIPSRNLWVNAKFLGGIQTSQTNKKFLGRAQNFCQCTQSFLKECNTVANKRKV